MEREEIANFNYRAFLKLIMGTPKLLSQLKKLGYKPQKNVFIDLDSPYLGNNLNGNFKSALLKVYRENFEENPKPKLVDELEKLKEELPLINGRDYRAELCMMEVDMAIEVKNELKRLKRTFSRDDDEPLEFMKLESTSDIQVIYPNGKVKHKMIDEPIDFNRFLDRNGISLYKVADLIEELKLLKQ